MTRPSISFCISTRGAADRVTRLIELVRPHVDEVVLAVHEQAEETIDACNGLVDRLLVHAPLEGASPSALVAWLLGHCSGDWILRLDDDELPSADLLEALPELTVDRRTACAVSLSRRWVYPDAKHWISGLPWGAEHQTRLLRNLPSLWTFSGENHTEGVFLADWATVPLPIYHLDLVLSSYEDRLLKRARYEQMVPDLIWDTLPLNDQYVPELHEPLALAEIPPADRVAVRALLDGGGTVRSRERGPRPAATALDEILRENSIRNGSSEDLHGQISFVNPRREMPIHIDGWFTLEVRNCSAAAWPQLEPPFVRAGARWLTEDGKPTYLQEARAHFRQTIWPGVPARITFSVKSPIKPGRYLLEADLAHEGVRWLGCQERVEVEVVPRRPRPAVDERRQLEPAVLHGQSNGRGQVGTPVQRLLDRATRAVTGAGQGARPRVPPAVPVSRSADTSSVSVEAGADSTNGSGALSPFLEDLYASATVTDENGQAIPIFGPSVSRDEAAELAAIVRDANLTQTLETGMALGLSTLAIAAVHAERGHGDHIAVDPTETVSYRAVGINNVERAGLAEYVRVIEEGSELALPRLAAEGARRDFVFIDGCHLFDYALLDFFYADRLLPIGGMVAFHDTWMPAVCRAIHFAVANRAYEQIPTVNANLALLHKMATDTRSWDHYVAC